MWKLFAIASAIFAAATTILAKIGLKDVNSNLATAVRTTVILLLSWGIVFYTNRIDELKTLTNKGIWFLIASGLATGLSWLCYFKALQIADASKVASIDKLSVLFVVVFSFIFLHERVTWQVLSGTSLIFAGTMLLLCSK